MEHLNFLEIFKDNLKKEIAIDLEKSLEKLFTVLNKQTAARNELLILKGRFNKVKIDGLKSIISYDTQTLATNQIRNAALEFVGDLEFEDFDPSFSPELKTNIDAYNATLEAESPINSKPTNPSVQKAGEHSTRTNPLTESSEEKLPASPKTSPAPLSISEYEVFVAQHQATLKAFPKVYRRAREISIRRDMDSATDFYQTTQMHLETLQKYITFLKPIQENIKQIRLDRNNEIYWLQYKMIKEVHETTEVDSLEKVTAVLPKLEDLYNSLDKLNLI